MKVIKYLYYLFIFLFLSGSNMELLGFPIKYILAVLLFFLVISSEIKFATSKIWILYMIFLLSFGVSCIVTGNIGLYLNQLLKSYFPAFVGCISTIEVVKKDRNNLKVVFIIILAIGVFNVFVNFSQFMFNTDWYEPIESIFKFSNDEEFSESIGMRQTYRDVNDGTLQGIFGNGVLNGYYLSLCTILSMVLVLKRKNILYLLLTVFFIAGSFICQQRSPLYASLLVIVVMFLFGGFKSFSNLQRTLFFIVITSFLIVSIPYFIEISESFGLRYTTRGLEGTGREDIYVNTFDYILSNPVLPNIFELMQQKGRAPHNLFFNAFVYGGIVSFISIMLILFYQFKEVVKIIKGGCSDDNVYYFVFAFAWIEYTLNCLVHNRSIITGDFTIWLIWGVLVTWQQFALNRIKRV